MIVSYKFVHLVSHTPSCIIINLSTTICICLSIYMEIKCIDESYFEVLTRQSMLAFIICFIIRFTTLETLLYLFYYYITLLYIVFM